MYKALLAHWPRYLPTLFTNKCQLTETIATFIHSVPKSTLITANPETNWLRAANTTADAIKAFMILKHTIGKISLCDQSYEKLTK